MGDICNIFIILLDLLLRPFTPATGVQLPLGMPSHLSKSLSILGVGRFFLEAWRVIFDCYLVRVHCDAVDELGQGLSFLWGYWFGNRDSLAVESLWEIAKKSFFLQRNRRKRIYTTKLTVPNFPLTNKYLPDTHRSQIQIFSFQIFQQIDANHFPILVTQIRFANKKKAFLYFEAINFTINQYSYLYLFLPISKYR